jgi:heparin/heparan-sulfate lyase
VSTRIELLPPAPSSTDACLNVMEVAGTNTAVMPAVERLSSQGVTGVRVASRVVWFQRESNRINRRFHLCHRCVTDAGVMRYPLTDLAEGTWQIWRDGRVVTPAAYVTDSEGTLYFQGPAGRYELRR